MTGCTAEPLGDHDYSQPPHNTPANPRCEPYGDAPCQAQSAAAPFGACEHERRYEIVLYQIGTHDWIRIFACVPCTATMRQRHAGAGPRRTQGVARVRDAIPNLPSMR